MLNQELTGIQIWDQGHSRFGAVPKIEKTQNIESPPSPSTGDQDGDQDGEKSSKPSPHTRSHDKKK